MQLFTRMTVINMMRAILTCRFLICCLLTTLILLFSCSGEIERSPDVIYLVDIGLLGGGGIFILMSGIFPIFPYALTYAVEHEEMAAQFWLIRAGVRRYAWSKIWTSAISGFMTTAFGLLAGIFLLLMKLPLSAGMPNAQAYQPLVEQGMPGWYLVCLVSHLALTSSLFTVAALCCSALFPNRFTSVAAPLVIYLIVHRLFDRIDLPRFLQPVEIVQGIYDAGSPGATILLKFGLTGVLCVLMGGVTVHLIRWRLQHE